jgi:glycolate dehydrogenase FAD-binding subunit
MNPASASVAARLDSVAGADRVNGSPEICDKYAVDGVVPSAVVKPSSGEEVAEIVRFAKSESLALIPCGNRTKMSTGMPPERYDFALDITGLNKVAYYDPDDLTLSVDAGIGLADLAQILSKKNQFVPLTVPFFEECTAGGTIASGIGSALRYSYGSARDFLLGAEFVNGAGTLTKSGGRVVKNVTGYDLHKLLIGSLGTLAVITRLNFRTFPIPQGYGQLVAAFPSPEAIVQFQSTVAKSPLTPSSAQILGPEAAQRLSDFERKPHAPLPSWFAPKHWHVCVGFDGAEPVLRRYSSDLVQYAEQSGSASYHLLDKSSSELLGSALRELPRLLSRSSPAATIFKIDVLPAFPADVQKLRDLADRLAIPCALFANLPGPIYFALEPKALDDGFIAALAQIAAGVFEYAASHNGHASILFCPPQLKRVVNVWGPARKDAELMRCVKTAFDPQNIFAPGRFVAGI